MRRALFVVGLLCLSAAIAAAQGKVSSSSSCPGSASGQSYEVGDQPNHWICRGEELAHGYARHQAQINQAHPIKDRRYQSQVIRW